MKATLSREGYLVITAENDLERYALVAYHKQCDSTGTSKIMFIYDQTPDGSAKPSDIEFISQNKSQEGKQ